MPILPTPLDISLLPVLASLYISRKAAPVARHRQARLLAYELGQQEVSDESTRLLWKYMELTQSRFDRLCIRLQHGPDDHKRQLYPKNDDWHEPSDDVECHRSQA